MVESHLPQKRIGNAEAKKKAKPESNPDIGTQEDGDKMEVDKASSKETLDALCVEDIREHAKLIEKSMVTKESRFLNRVLRSLLGLRGKLNPEVLQKAVSTCCHADLQGKNDLLALIERNRGAAAAASISMGSSSSTTPVPPPSSATKRDLKFSSSVMIEIQTYLSLLIVVYYLDQKSLSQGITAAKFMINKVHSTSNRSTDLLSAKCFFYYARVHEESQCLTSIRDHAHSYLRSSIIHHNHESAAVLINVLLRIYLHQNQYEFAWNFIEKTTFPKEASNNEVARHLYYLGRIKAVKLDYSASQKDLMEAVRKAPQKVAIGFRQQVQKLACVVNLLLGEIPERAIFQIPHYKKPLEPYLMLTRAVRTGNLEDFKQVSARYKEKFIRDGTFMLIGRLRHNVIKAGIKRINASYSCISLEDIATKLCLDSPNDALYTVAKAIKDKVIQAKISYEQGWMQSLENPDVYSSLEPTMQYQARLAFMMDIHKQCTLALRYPADSFSVEGDDANSRREREAADLEDLVDELDEEEGDDDNEDLFP